MENASEPVALEISCWFSPFRFQFLFSLFVSVVHIKTLNTNGIVKLLNLKEQVMLCH